jgi:hypothetical protein
MREREQALSALSLMRREQLSLKEAARKLDISPNVVLRHAKDGLRRSVGGHYYAKPFDSISRPPMRFLTDRGNVWVTVRDSREATRVSKYMTAIKHYLHTGRTSLLAPFRGKGIGRHRFVTDPEILDELADAGELEFDALYNFVFGARR